MDCMNAIRLLPAVREHETNKELFWQVELPATDRVRLQPRRPRAHRARPPRRDGALGVADASRRRGGLSG